MTIPRLAPSAEPLTVPIEINEKLLPYFQVWYQRKKLDAESPSQFAIRYLKQSALSDYLADIGKAEADKIEEAKQTSINDLNADAAVLQGEVD